MTLVLSALIFLSCRPFWKYAIQFKGGGHSLNSRQWEKGLSKDGYPTVIQAYRSIQDIDVLVADKYLITNRTYMDFKRGNIASPYYKSVYGVGYLGEGPYKTKIDGKVTPQYAAWKGMLGRCYAQYTEKCKRTYLGCIVCDEWLNFQLFAAWYDANYYKIVGEKMHLDKDLLCKGNKVYSPTTCVYVPHMLNTILLNKSNFRGSLPVGVEKNFNKYIAKLNKRTPEGVISREYLGMFKTPDEAFQAYKKEKEAYIKAEADRYKAMMTKERDVKIFAKVYNALYAYEVHEKD